VNVYVIDSGIRTDHTEFAGRAFAAADAINDGWSGQDCHGHGTHVAGTIGGKTYGIAKSAYLYSVRALDCSNNGTVSGITAAVNWVTRYHRKPAVVNMSLGGPTGTDYTMDLAVNNSSNAGITYVVSAGNSGADACGFSPARAAGAITVGATDGADRRVVDATWSSNYGACVDIWAPGYGIQSAGRTSTTAAAIMGGTSMASPHVAGAAAIYLSAYPYATPTQVRNAIISTATQGRLTGIGATSPNRLLYSLMR
jgi:subtilisin family serine protease